MIFPAFKAALGQIGDRGFRRILVLGTLLSLALLFAAYAVFLHLVWWLTPESLDIPILGPVRWVGAFFGWDSLLVLAFLSTFLMVPVASVFAALFHADVARSVEARHYAFLPPTQGLAVAENLRRGVNFLGVVVVANMLGLLTFPLLGLAAPLLFWLLNGLLLGREYFGLAALRHLPEAEAKALRRRNIWTIWAAGSLMAAALLIPLVNLLIPTLGVASFTQLFHKMMAAGS